MKKLLLFLALAAAGLQGRADENEGLYLVGGCTDSGWKEGESTRSAVRAYTADGKTWVWAGKFTTDDGIDGNDDDNSARFKIPNNTAGWGKYYAPSQNYPLTSAWAELSTNSEDDRKYRISKAGLYLVTINTSEKKIKAEELTKVPSKLGDYYLISDIDEYYWFAAYIASNETRNAKARLTADLDFTDKTFLPLASQKYPFTGEFDGNGHTINKAVVSSSAAYSKIGLFACVSSGAYIHDLIIGENCSFSGWAKVAGIAGHALDGGESVGTVTLSNIINKADVTSTNGKTGNEGHTAGFIACCNGNVKLSATNCANTGNIDGQSGECAAFVGWNGTARTSFTNCWNIGTIADDDIESGKRLCRGSGTFTFSNCYDKVSGQGTLFTDAKLASGELCYLLNESTQAGTAWYQNLSGTTDPTPIPFSTHEKVYKFGAADTYLNDGSTVNIGNANDLDNFSTIVNAGATSVNAIVTTSFPANSALTPIGTSTNMYKGTFDGGGNNITLSINNTGPSVGHCALIGYATGGATIQNLILKGSVNSSGETTAGFIAETNGGGSVTITNCGNEATISGGAKETAAIIANNYGASCALLLTNVYNTANVSGSGDVSTICGYQANYQSVFENVYNSGTPTVTSGTLEGHFARGTINQNNGNPTSIGTYTRCFSTTLNSNTQHDYPDVTNIRKIEVSDVSSGELTCLLNGSTNGGTNFYQTLGTDAHPVFDSTHGKVWKCLCTESNAEIRYANSAIGQSTTHAFNEPNSTGYCSQCLNYNVSTGAQMKSIADGISTETIDNDIKIYFTQDIDFDGVAGYAGIGTDNDGKRFCGLLDGQDHFVMNMNVDSNQSGVGLIGTASDGADIKNVIVTSSCTVKGNQYVAGIVGSTNGNGTIKITRCGNEAAIQATNGNNSNAAGILGCRRGSNRIEISNCYNTGTITGPKESAGICAWTGKKFKIEKCYNNGTISGTIDNNQYFARFDGDGGDWDDSSTIADCYQINDNDGTAVSDKTYSKNNNTYTVKAIPADSIASGQLCYALGSDIWWQTLGVENSHPIPFSTSKTVYRYNNAGSYLYSNLDKNASKVSISSAKDLNDFSALVNVGSTTLNAELTADIDMTGKSYTPIGTSTYKYAGTFDGQYKTIKLNINTTQDNQALFGIATANTEIKNLIVEGSVTARQRAAGLIGYADGDGTITLTNIINKASIDATASTSEANAAGLVGCAVNGIIINATNCGNTGKISNSGHKSGTEQCAAFAGWLNKEGTTFTNCWNIGEISNMEGEAQLYRNSQKGSTTNCYYLTGVSDQGEKLDATAAYTGELCYLLKGNQETNAFTQTIGTDAYPTFGSATVDRGQWFSDDYIYYNVDESGNITVNELNLDDTKTTYNVPAKVTAKSVTLTRTLHALTADGTTARWNTFCSPVAIDKSNFSAAKELTGVTANGNNYSMAFTDVAGDVLEAGKPYMVQVSKGKSSLTASNVAVAETVTPVTINGLTFTGNFTNGNAPLGSFIISNNVFYNVDSDVTLNAFRGYITTASNVKALTFDFDDDATSLSSISSPEGKECIYNLAGQRIQKMQKGINIVNGKKVMVK